MADHRQLLVWQKAHQVALGTNRLASKIRMHQYSSLRSQMVRAALSVPTNIVEGRAQSGSQDFIRFLRYALGSAAELEYHLQVAHEFGLCELKEYHILQNEITEVRRMLQGLIRTLKETRS